jgi:GNAT superfamily N-acetyltransferase
MVRSWAVRTPGDVVCTLIELLLDTPGGVTLRYIAGRTNGILATISDGMLRPFEDRDYSRLAAIGAAIEPTHARDVEWYQRLDRARQPHERHLRLVWETDGQVVACGEVGHVWWGFHPRKFGLWLTVDPPGRGIGTRLHDALVEFGRQAWALRSPARTPWTCGSAS